MSATPSAMAPGSQRRPILLVERDELALRARARGSPRIGQEHERQQPRDLGLVGDEAMEHAGETKRLARQVGPQQTRARR